MYRQLIPSVAAACAFAILAHAQDPLRGDAAFNAFFHEVAVKQNFGYASPENTLMIGSNDWSRVKTIASECDRQTNAIDTQLSRAVLDLRLTAIAGENTAAAQARVNRLQTQQRAAVMEHIRQLQDALGPQFQNVSNFLDSYQTAPPYFNRPTPGKVAFKAR